MPKVAVVILNWNGQHFLEQFLPALIKHTPEEIADIIIADNGSNDQSLSWIKKNHPQLLLIELSENFGFAGGYNKAIESCPHEFILLLNSDVEVTEGWLEPLTKAMESTESGAVMPNILSYENKGIFEYAGAQYQYLNLANKVPPFIHPVPAR